MTNLEQALLDRTKLSAKDVAHAESRRSEMGGRLETALLELGLVSESELSPALAAHYHLPSATASDLQNIPESVRALVSSEHAGAYLAIPFAAAPGRVDVAVGAALKLEKADELAFLLGRRVRFFVLNEVRVAQALHKHYGLAQPARLLNLADRLERGLGPSRDLASEPPTPKVPATAAGPGTFGNFGTDAGRHRVQPNMGVTRRVTPSKPREERRSVSLSEEERQAIFGPRPEPAPATDPDLGKVPASDLARLSLNLQAATSPTGVGKAFLDYLASVFETVLLLRPEGELFCGWLAHGSSIGPDQLRLLITGPGLANEWRELAREQAAASYLLGPSAVAVELDAALDAEAGSTVALVPVRVQERIVCLAACSPDRHLTRNAKELLSNAGIRTGLALQSWIMRHKTFPKGSS